MSQRLLHNIIRKFYPFHTSNHTLHSFSSYNLSPDLSYLFLFRMDYYLIESIHFPSKMAVISSLQAFENNIFLHNQHFFSLNCCSILIYNNEFSYWQVFIYLHSHSTLIFRVDKFYRFLYFCLTQVVISKI